VFGLARSEAGAQALLAAGAEAHMGELEDFESLQRGAAAADGVIHTAFIHDFSKFKENCELDRRVIEALGATLAGSDRPLVVTSGTALLAGAGVATENDHAVSVTIPRTASEEAATLAASRGARIGVVRLPPSVHGAGDHAFLPRLIALAREKGHSAYVGDGRNHWPAVHRLDAAQLYRLALEKCEAGARYHAVADEGVSFRDIAGVIGRRLGLPVVSITSEEAVDHFGWFVHFATIDNRVSSRLTREALGWRPTQPGLIADFDGPSYFSA
jgi:nucleoside-diphosphate-sugar epimerase